MDIDIPDSKVQDSVHVNHLIDVIYSLCEYSPYFKDIMIPLLITFFALSIGTSALQAQDDGIVYKIIPGNICSLPDNLYGRSYPELDRLKPDNYSFIRFSDELQNFEFEGKFDANKYNIVIIGSGYSNTDSFLADFSRIKNLENGALPGIINIIGIINHSDLVEVEQTDVGRAPIPNNDTLEKVMGSLWFQGYPVNVVATMVNTDGYFGSGSFFPLFAGHNENTEYLFTHEVAGHRVGMLSDGYSRPYYDVGIFNSTEFEVEGFPKSSIITELTKDVPKALHPYAYCGARKVLEYYPEFRDVMGDHVRPEDFIIGDRTYTELFNPLQRYFIEECARIAIQDVQVKIRSRFYTNAYQQALLMQQNQ